ncbi:MAG: hypothetical protein ACRD0K_09930, partial [Egibacteraceae bacterium]
MRAGRPSTRRNTRANSALRTGSGAAPLRIPSRSAAVRAWEKIPTVSSIVIQLIHWRPDPNRPPSPTFERLDVAELAAPVARGVGADPERLGQDGPWHAVEAAELRSADSVRAGTPSLGGGGGGAGGGTQRAQIVFENRREGSRLVGFRSSVKGG